MIALALCLAFGLLLAQRFKVLILPPATLLVVIMALAGGVASAATFWTNMLMAVMAAVNLQVGYLLGLGVQSFWIASRSRRRLASSARPTRRTAH
jgi:hypothetical protein